MLINSTMEQLRELRLTGMVEALSEQLQDSTAVALSFEERLGLLIDRESAVRSNRLLQTRLKQSKLHFPQASLEDVNYDQKR